MNRGIVGSLFGGIGGAGSGLAQEGAILRQQAREGISTGLQNMFGVRTPEQQLQTIIQQAQKQFDLDTPQGLTGLADMLNQVPELSGMAMSIRQEAAKMASQAGAAALKQRETEADIDLKRANIGLKQAQTAGIMAEMNRPPPPPKLETPETEAERAMLAKFTKEFGDTPDGRARAADAFFNWKNDLKVKVAAAGAPAPTPTERAVLPGKANILKEIETGALNASKIEQTANAIDRIVNTAFTGFGSDAKLKASQIANAFGVTVTGTTETEQLKQLLAQLTQGQARSLPGALSEKELMFLREAIGTPGFTVQTLRSVVDRLRREAVSAELENTKVQEFVANGGDLNKYNFVAARKQAQNEAKAQLDQTAAKRLRLEELRRKQMGQ
jgi:hypothetical protein